MLNTKENPYRPTRRDRLILQVLIQKGRMSENQLFDQVKDKLKPNDFYFTLQRLEKEKFIEVVSTPDNNTQNHNLTKVYSLTEQTINLALKPTPLITLVDTVLDLCLIFSKEIFYFFLGAIKFVVKSVFNFW